MSEKTVKLSAIVVKSSQSGENDKLLTLLSPEEGKLTVTAKGVRSLKHPSRNACCPLCYSSFVLKKIKEGFYSLVSAELIEGFRTLSEDVVLLSYGAYFAALTEFCVQIGTQASEEVRLLLNCLHVLGKRPENASLIKAVFEFKLMELIGIVPEFSLECPCGNKGSFFSISDGEMRCSQHRTQDSVSISDLQIKAASYITQNSLRDALFSSCNQEISDSLSEITEPFLLYHLGNLPKSLDYLHKIINKTP